MTEREFSILVKGMKSIYSSPSFIADKNAFDVWFSLLKDLEYMDCSRAIQKHMQTSEYQPTVATIRKIVAAFKDKDSAVPNEYFFNEIKSAVSKGIYYSESAFSDLSDISKQVVGSSDNLRAWAVMDSNEFNTVQKSYILKAVDKIRQNDAEMKTISPNLKDIFEQVLKGLEKNEEEVKKIEGD